MPHSPYGTASSNRRTMLYATISLHVERPIPQAFDLSSAQRTIHYNDKAWPWNVTSKEHEACLALNRRKTPFCLCRSGGGTSTSEPISPLSDDSPDGILSD